LSIFARVVDLAAFLQVAGDAAGFVMGLKGLCVYAAGDQNILLKEDGLGE
jgi:hypothetical protein